MATELVTTTSIGTHDAHDFCHNFTMKATDAIGKRVHEKPDPRCESNIHSANHRVFAPIFWFLEPANHHCSLLLAPILQPTEPLLHGKYLN